MKVTHTVACGLLVGILYPQNVMAQAFGEYGRAVGGVTQRQGGAVPDVGGVGQGTGKGGSQGIGDLGGRALPALLVVVTKEAVLFPRQDEESEKIRKLSEGETLVPMVQSAGANQWYMVKTQQGLIGWVKSTDVREQAAKKR